LRDGAQDRDHLILLAVAVLPALIVVRRRIGRRD
jgi:hypothetical protein